MRVVQAVAGIFGVVFTGIALLGFITGGMSMDAHMASATKVAGLFPVNAAHNAVHLVFGIWGLFAARTASSARKYCLLSGAIYLVLAGLGFVLPEVFGLIPIGGNDIMLHAAIGIALTVVGALVGSDESAPARA